MKSLAGEMSLVLSLALSRKVVEVDADWIFHMPTPGPGGCGRSPAHPSGHQAQHR